MCLKSDLSVLWLWSRTDPHSTRTKIPHSSLSWGTDTEISDSTLIYKLMCGGIKLICVQAIRTVQTEVAFQNIRPVSDYYHIWKWPKSETKQTKKLALLHYRNYMFTLL